MAPSAGRIARLHGFDLHVHDTGQGEPVVLVHGLLGSHHEWTGVAAELAADHRVLAPDLFGHGASAKPMGDYSLGAHAATLRDLLDHLDLGPVTLVGHSLGGGIAMQFAYLFPDRVRRLVLVSSGGLGRELSLLLRVATLPGAEYALPLLTSRWVRGGGDALGRSIARTGLHTGSDLGRAWQRLVSLSDAESRRAFLATSRAVIDPGGQTVTARHRFSAVGGVPTLLVWGSKDRLIPAWHAVAAQDAIPGSRVVVFEGAGHFPHLDDQERFVRLLQEFMADTSTADGPARRRGTGGRRAPQRPAWRAASAT